MRNILKFIIRFHYPIIFLVFETLAVFLVVQTNHYHKAAFVNSSGEIAGYFYSITSSVSDYLNLRSKNYTLAKENTELRNMLYTSFITNDFNFVSVNDTVYKQRYSYCQAKVINNSVTNRLNLVTLDKGSRHGIKPEMGVICSEGIVGIVKDVSPNFCIVIPAININAYISAKIKKNGYFGTISWDGLDSQTGQLNEIPFHIKLTEGDTIVTSGFSTMFPDGIMIGTIKKSGLNEGNNFYDIDVKFSTDFYRLDFVYIIDNLYKEEQNQLERENQ